MKVRRYLSLLAVLIFMLIVVGGMVRNLGAGLSCPDWPLCKGKIIPDFDLQVFAEYFHRLFAASVSILTLGLSVVIFRDQKLRSALGKWMGLALGFLLSQVILGGLTVLKFLQSEIVMLHLGTGTLFFGTILFMSLKAKTLEDTESLASTSQTLQKPTDTFFATKPTGTLAFASLGVLYVQILLGGEVSSHYAGLACPDFPTCMGTWLPMLTGPILIQLAHRLGATLVFFTLLFFGLKIIRIARSLQKSAQKSSLQCKGIGILVLLLTQISLGVGNVLFRLPIAMSVAHLAVAEGLLALVLMSAYEIYNL